MFRWMLAAGLLLVNVWMCIAVMLAMTNDPFAGTYAMAIFVAVGLTFFELKLVERFAHWKAPQIDPTPRQDYWGIGVGAAIFFAIALWIVTMRAGPTPDDKTETVRTNDPRTPAVNLERGSAAAARIDQAE